MENKEFSRQLQNRTKAFAIRIIRLSSKLPNSVEGKIIRSQLAKAGTSIGQITGKQTDQEAKPISEVKSGFAKVNPVSHAIGFKLYRI